MTEANPPSSKQGPLRGVFPILATCFDDQGAIDYDSQARLIEFCIDSGVHGLVMLANASEGHLLSEDEKRNLLEFGLEKIGGRVPVIATVSHPSSRIMVEAALNAERIGASAIMALPPFFGRWRPSLSQVYRHFQLLDARIGVPVVLQDHALTDITLPADFIADLARKLESFKYVKLESGNLIEKTRALARLADQHLHGIFGGNSGIFMPEEIEAGCTGTMPACYMPEVFRRAWDLLEVGDKGGASSYFAPYSRIAAYEKDVCNRCAWKVVLAVRGVIASDAIREPTPPFANDYVKGQLLSIAVHAGLLPAEVLKTRRGQSEA